MVVALLASPVAAECSSTDFGSSVAVAFAGDGCGGAVVVVVVVATSTRGRCLRRVAAPPTRSSLLHGR